MNRAELAWFAIVIPMWIALVLCTYWEPIAYDGWGHYFWHRTHDTTLVNLYEVARGSYEHNNPRLGQLVTLLLFTPGPWHVIVMPLVALALFYLLTALVLGRWPSWCRSDDALLYVLVVAMSVVASPVIGQMLFYRPYVGNYTFGLVTCLALLVPYRFALERADANARRRPLQTAWQVPAMLALGFAAGMCNEHTGPTVAALAIAATIANASSARRRPCAWMVAGVIGIVAGGLALFYAPGQDLRYHGLATQHTLLARVASRGLYETAEIVLGPYLYALSIAPWIAIAIVARNYRGSAQLSGASGGANPPHSMSGARAGSLVALASASLAIVVTLLASPKVGARLYFAAQLFVVAAAAGWIVPQLGSRGSKRVAAGLAAATLALAGWRCVHVYREIAPEFATRLDALERAVPGTTVALPTYSFGSPRAGTRGYQRDIGTVLRWFVDSRWFIGDDLLVARWRDRLAHSFQLAITLTGADAFEREVVDDDP